MRRIVLPVIWERDMRRVEHASLPYPFHCWSMLNPLFSCLFSRFTVGGYSSSHAPRMPVPIGFSQRILLVLSNLSSVSPEKSGVILHAETRRTVTLLSSGMSGMSDTHVNSPSRATRSLTVHLRRRSEIGQLFLAQRGVSGRAEWRKTPESPVYPGGRKSRGRAISGIKHGRKGGCLRIILS